MFEQADANHDGKLQCEEFVDCMLRVLAEIKDKTEGTAKAKNTTKGTGKGSPVGSTDEGGSSGADMYKQYAQQAQAEGRAPVPDSMHFDDLTCKVCQKQQLEVLLLPCRHFCVCSDCANKLPNEQCPLCSGKVLHRISVFG